jgi:hypothetical protein
MANFWLISGCPECGYELTRIGTMSRPPYEDCWGCSQCGHQVMQSELIELVECFETSTEPDPNGEEAVQRVLMEMV